jgi:hypothetical protein
MRSERIKEELALVRLLIGIFFTGFLASIYSVYKTSGLAQYFLIVTAFLLVALIIIGIKTYLGLLDELESSRKS